MLLKLMQQSWIAENDFVYWVDLAHCKGHDLPAYIAKEISKSGHAQDSVTGEERLFDALSIALEEARKHADKQDDRKQMVVIILDGIHEITSPEYSSRFVDAIRVVKEFDGKGKLPQDTRIHWRMILSHRLPLSTYQSSLPTRDRSVFDGMNTVPVTPWTSNEIRSYIQSHGDGQSRFVYQCQASHRLVPKLWRVTGGYPALINAYLYSFGDLYRLHLQYKRPLYVIKEIYEQIEDPCRITPMVRCTAENLARSFVSLLCQEQQEVLRHDIAGRYCSLDNCLGVIESKCSREYYPALCTLKKLGIWRTDTRACPFGSPLIATSLFFDH